ncbi:hypothetical protein EDD16DRAFT_1844746 [Pisolithus croceorrhizus]|nr:hypothetical protein EDD16DRAFT_1844746 [Pisolithus croceorrhizus]
MENAAGRSSPDDSSNMTVALAASSMVNPADFLSTEAYQANLRRIEEMKDIIRRLEANNDQAHRNYLMDQLEKRAREGREAEEMLQKLRSSGQLPPTLNTSGHPARANVLLPSTATLVEVPDYPSTNPAPSATGHPSLGSTGLPKFSTVATSTTANAYIVFCSGSIHCAVPCTISLSRVLSLCPESTTRTRTHGAARANQVSTGGLHPSLSVQYGPFRASPSCQRV